MILFALSASARHIHFFLRGGRIARRVVDRRFGLYLGGRSTLRSAKVALRRSPGGRLAISTWFISAGGRLTIASTWFISSGSGRLATASAWLISSGVDTAIAGASSVAGIVAVFITLLVTSGIVVAAVVAIAVAVAIIVVRWRSRVVSEMRGHVVHTAHTHRAVRIVGNVVVIVVVVIGNVSSIKYN